MDVLCERNEITIYSIKLEKTFILLQPRKGISIENMNYISTHQLENYMDIHLKMKSLVV